jgi:hypothetical protein
MSKNLILNTVNETSNNEKPKDNLIIYVDPFIDKDDVILLNYVKTLFYKPIIHQGLKETLRKIEEYIYSEHKHDIISEVFATCLKSMSQPKTIIRSINFESYYTTSDDKNVLKFSLLVDGQTKNTKSLEIKYDN